MEQRGSAGAWPVAAPMPKLESLSEKKGGYLDWRFRPTYLFPLGWPCIYNVYCSQFEGPQDSFLLDEVFFAFIERDIKGKTVAFLFDKIWFIG